MPKTDSSVDDDLRHGRLPCQHVEDVGVFGRVVQDVGVHARRQLLSGPGLGAGDLDDRVVQLALLDDARPILRHAVADVAPQRPDAGLGRGRDEVHPELRLLGGQNGDVIRPLLALEVLDKVFLVDVDRPGCGSVESGIRRWAGRTTSPGIRSGFFPWVAS